MKDLLELLELFKIVTEILDRKNNTTASIAHKSFKYVKN